MTFLQKLESHIGGLVKIKVMPSAAQIMQPLNEKIVVLLDVRDIYTPNSAAALSYFSDARINDYLIFYEDEIEFIEASQ